MITYIKGIITEKTPAYVVIETAGGVAYGIHISLATFSQLKETENVKLLTHYVIKEDAHQLFGFYTEEERSLFRLLITVNGIGVNTARLILSSLSTEELIHAIATENIKAIQGVKGIGLKTAQRVIIDLKDKIGKGIPQNIEKISISYNNNREEALFALLSLGFVKNSADSALEKIIRAEGTNLSVEELIKKALKVL
ncbi:MAG: Holliday junction branch migration protein RuvA [Bacteroidetes bacterium]|nr:Holliday junction branch migration protein RuvA [Bacteroidota bacterium]MCL1968527.1 Holliday junction branch migration protein RuvA [Bacteroidota bacterium]